MRAAMVRYRVKPEHAAENVALVQAVYRELEQTQPDGLSYATFRLDDGVSFVHIAIEEDEGTGALSRLAAFQRFREGIAERCDEPPAATELHEIGSFRPVDR